ncbi:NAD(+)/NADH kinase [Natronosalvus vescus]|uniref:NAD(+)/NADH kinase n=1 Tax=Natronosalvus vescus TaxID=2953881 RepID=UPI00209088A7|nr:NAD(+)/NADH kinase [Natronosalvus vescus]
MVADVGIVAQRDNERARAIAEELVRTVAAFGADAVVDDATGNAVDAPAVPVSAMGDCAFVVSIGGDGTFLFVARETGGVPLIGINLGEVGFLNAVSPAAAVDAVEGLLEEHQETSTIEGRSVPRLQASGEGWTLEPALNEIVVHGPRRGPAGGVEVDVAIDGVSYARSWADGTLVSTPTGSTAYNLSEGGPLVHPTVDALVVTQMCAAESMPPLVVGADSEVTLTLSGRGPTWAISDGRTRQELEPPETVTVTVADDPITLAGPEVHFFDALEKLE